MIEEEDLEDEARDAGLISAAQRVEHCEIAAYGCVRTYANLWATPKQGDFSRRRFRKRRKQIRS
jgi:ferritin-like metal-binding protein YciE